MSLNWSSASREAQQAGVKVLVYGGAGLGKTVLATTMGPASVLISAESGTLSLRKANLERLHGANNPTINYDIPILTVTNITELHEIYAWLTRTPEGQQVRNVALDSISEIAEVCLNNAKRTVKDPRQAYGALAEQMESLVRAYRDLPGRNVYMAAKMASVKDELTGVVKFGPSMPGTKLGQALPYFFDEVFRLGTNKDAQGKEFRFLQTQPDIQFDAKDRSGALAPLEFPHLGSLFAKIQGA